MQAFEKGKLRERNKEWIAIRGRIRTIQNKVKRLDLRYEHKDWLERNDLVEELRILKAKQLTISSVDPMDENYRRMKYVRYADDFVIGIASSKMMQNK